jgi:fermentation-respiration switch protein FrsA (DUF1100 family)
MSVQTRDVAYSSAGIAIAGRVFLPDGFSEAQAHAALVLATPGSSVKEQIGSNYARRLAARGWVALTFDPSYQGQSGGEPRDLESPATRVEDLRSAVDYLVTQPFVDAQRIGVLGICAGGGYVVNAALIEKRFRAVGVVVPVNIGRARRDDAQAKDALISSLAEVGDQRTREARGAAARRDPWIPDTPQQAVDAGITDRDLLEAVDFYRTPRGYSAHSTNRLYFNSAALLMGFDAFHLVDPLLTQPLQVVVGGRKGNTGSYNDGRWLADHAPGETDFLVIEGAGHYALYDVPEYIDPAVERLAAFYARHLG